MATTKGSPQTNTPVPLESKLVQPDHGPSALLPASPPQGPAPTFDPVGLKKKYLSERDKRLKNSGGINQYQLLDDGGRFSAFLEDPWVKPGFERSAVKEKVDVVIVGGGFGAQIVAVRLLVMGISRVRLIEKAGDFGGTWYWNKYPGAQCDIESYIYMPLLEELGYMPTEKYAYASELLEHSQRIGKRYGLYDKALFQTEVRGLRWNEGTALWSVETSRGDSIQARFVVPSAGPLHRPKLPGVPGIESFKGHVFHSSRWDYKYTGGEVSRYPELRRLGDKRVGIIGTGATAVQIVPNVAKYAKELYVFQRTPSSIDVRANRPTDPAWSSQLQPGWQQERMDNFDTIVNGGILPEDHVQDGWTDILHRLHARVGGAAKVDVAKAATERQMADFEKMEQVRERCNKIVKDKETAERLKPWYNQFCKRPCFHDEYLQAYNRDTVHLVDTEGKGVDRITENGIVANGHEVGLDCIIYCTGFELATSWSHRSNVEIWGRDGQTITSAWRDGARTLHSWTTRGFPNCFWMQIVHAALTPNFLHVTSEQARHIAYVISEANKRGVRTVEPTPEAEAKWVETIVQSAAAGAEFLKDCTPGYYNNEGTPSATAARNGVYGAGSPAFLKLLRDWREKGTLEGLELAA